MCLTVVAYYCLLTNLCAITIERKGRVHRNKSGSLRKSRSARIPNDADSLSQCTMASCLEPLQSAHQLAFRKQIGGVGIAQFSVVVEVESGTRYMCGCAVEGAS